MPILPLEKQEAYRRRYARSRPRYRTGGQVFEELLMRNLPSAQRVLDAGCGRAGILQDHHQEIPFLVGADSDASSLRDNARLHAAVLSDLGALPFADASFHLVGCTWVMEHLKDPEPVFREVGRVLQTGGRFLVLTPNAWSYASILNRAIPRRLQASLVLRVYGRESQDTFPTIYAANTRERLARLAKAGEMEEVSFHYVGDPTYLAWHPLLYWLGVFLESLTDWRPLRRFKVHLVGEYLKVRQVGEGGRTGTG